MSVGPNQKIREINTKVGALVAIRFTHIRLSGGNDHQHIVRLWWVNPADNETGNNTRAELVDWIQNQNGKAYVEDSAGHRADVGVATPTQGARYLRTYADGRWTNNLLSLPQQ